MATSKVPLVPGTKTLARGSVVIGNASGEPSALAIGSNTYVLKSDGTDISWGADQAGTITAFTNGVDNRIVTATSATALNGEANLTWDGSDLIVTNTGANVNALQVKTTADNQVGIVLEKSDFSTGFVVDIDNDGSKNFTIRREMEDGSTSRLNYLYITADGRTNVMGQTSGFALEQGNTGNANKSMGNILSTTTDVLQFVREDFTNYVEVTLSSYMGYRKEVFRAYQSLPTSPTAVIYDDTGGGMAGSMTNISGSTWKYSITTTGNSYSTSVNLFFNGCKGGFTWL